MGKSHMSCPRTCGTCARILDRDLNRGYCPVAAMYIRRNSPVGRCKFYVMDECLGSDGKPMRRNRNVR